MGEYTVRTKFLPPGSSARHWKKAALWEKYRLCAQYPLTVVKAGPGFGKSTTLAAFFQERGQYFWYNVDELDADPAVFFTNLFHAVRLKHPSLVEGALAALADGPGSSGDYLRALNLFINSAANLEEDAYLIVDDFHLVAANSQILELMSHLVRLLPPRLHLILATREKLGFREWASWRLKRLVLVIDEQDLMLTSGEIADFFADQYGLAISPGEAEKAARETEGWIIALDLLGQGLTQGAELDEVLRVEAPSLELLFEYLAFEVLENQSPEVQEFLLQTAVLKNLKVDICNKLLGRQDSQEILSGLHQKGLFVFMLAPDLYRYHHLVREFLHKQGRSRYDYQQLHRRAAEICTAMQETDLAIFHLLKAEDFQGAAAVLISCGEEMLRLARFDSLHAYLKELPEAVFASYPQLYLYLGEVLRLKSMFKEALQVLHRAREIFLQRQDLLQLSHTSQRIAQVYLDTVQPVLAADYLQEALKYRDKENRWEEASILKLMAENKANQGLLDQAMALQKRAQELDRQEVYDSNIRARVLLRTGRLAEAIDLLERKLAAEQQRAMSLRAHRETVLILSLAHSLRGEVERAWAYASQGVELGRQYDSPFIVAVAHMRLGHSLQLMDPPKVEEARRAYQASLEIVDELEVARGRAEPLMGLSLLEAFFGDSNLGLHLGREALEILQLSGDQWLSGMVRIGLGINHYFLAQWEAAAQELRTAAADFASCQDDYCLLAAKLWLALVYFQSQQKERYAELLEQIFRTKLDKEAQILLKVPSLLGFRDRNMVAPLLLDASQKLKDNLLLQGLLAEHGLAGLEYHPGYTLKVQTLGNLRLWRGKEEIGSKEWQREKALELFLLLFLNRGKYLPREIIFDTLWPEDDLETAARNFKVSLNAVRKALEPDRTAQQTSFYILRSRSNYGFNPQASYVLDAEELERLIRLGDSAAHPHHQAELYREAIKLYRGDFLEDLPYLEWVADERERLRSLFLDTADKLARYLYEREENEEALKLTELLLQHDPCWEPAYLLQMKIYARTNRPFLAVKVYQRCCAVLDRELNVTPMPAIERFYQKLTSKM